MYSRFHYILIFLIVTSIYLIYLIGRYTMQQFQTDSFIHSIETANQGNEERNEEKVFLSQYIHTKAYETLVAKATQNKKLPGEIVVNIIRQDEIDGNANLDTNTVITNAQKWINDPTAHMSNPERWWYMLQHGINSPG